MTKTRIILDTDPGADDALTILLMLASPEISLEGITTVHGNVPLEKTTRNALALLEFFDRKDIPVARGCSLPLIKAPHVENDNVHGTSGLGRTNLPEPTLQPVAAHAVDYLIQRFLAEPKELTLFAIGPLTNVALAIRQEPKFAEAIKEMVIMGGAIRSGGNMTPLAEFNIYEDPHAAHVVFNAGIPITLVPLDATYQCLLSSADVERLNRIDSPIPKFIRDVTADYMEFYLKYEGFSGCALHDPLTLAAIIAPQLLTLESHYVNVDISGGVSEGKTYADFMKVTKRPANMRVALDVKGREFVELFLERIEKFCAANAPTR
ncbi:MAG: nucleoside hydrolase [Anaerolineales bacterium]|nr:nucleoside hydrolase [Anaerolineales bacterium]